MTSLCALLISIYALRVAMHRQQPASDTLHVGRVIVSDGGTSRVVIAPNRIDVEDAAGNSAALWIEDGAAAVGAFNGPETWACIGANEDGTEVLLKTLTGQARLAPDLLSLGADDGDRIHVGANGVSLQGESGERATVPAVAFLRPALFKKWLANLGVTPAIVREWLTESRDEVEIGI